jgi:DNA-binding NarL/FixJ family response regulator
VADCLAVATDLYFQSRIAAAARAAGRSVRFIGSDADLATAASAPLAVVDLDANLDVISAIRRLKQLRAYVVAFGPHMDTSARKAARAAGADRTLAKSKFVTELPGIMRGASAGSETGARSL